jgi:hypothetical protein
MAPSRLNGSPGFDTSSWHPARLIPTAGIRGQEEQEKRATSSLLAVMRAVPEFGHALLKELGAPKSPVIETFTEVRFKDGAGKSVIPDGAIVCRRGSKTWTCLVEVKTAGAPLRDEQVNSYLDIARDNGFDGVLTISNQITAASSESPVTVDGRKLKRTCLWHFSWWRVLTEAIVQHRYRGISDPDQAWILGELIAYLDSSASGAGGFEDMGDKWVTVRKAAHDGTLRQNNPEARIVAERWEEFTQYLCLGLSFPRCRHQSRRGSRRLTCERSARPRIRSLPPDTSEPTDGLCRQPSKQPRPDSPGARRQSVRASPRRVLRDRDLDVSSGPPAAALPRPVWRAHAQIELTSWRVINGSLPPRALRLVREWARMHPNELADNWERAQALEPLVAIEPLA